MVVALMPFLPTQFVSMFLYGWMNLRQRLIWQCGWEWFKEELFLEWWYGCVWNNASYLCVVGLFGHWLHRSLESFDRFTSICPSRFPCRFHLHSGCLHRSLRSTGGKHGLPSMRSVLQQIELITNRKLRLLKQSFSFDPLSRDRLEVKTSCCFSSY